MFPSRATRRAFGDELLHPREAVIQIIVELCRFLRQKQFPFMDVDGRPDVVDICAVVEEREELVVLAMADRIILVRMALRATDGEAKPDGAGRGHAVHHRFDAKLLVVHAPFLVDERVTMKTRGDPLFARRVGQKIAGQLLDRELIEGHVRVERANHPIAIRPHHANRVDRIPVRVRVARLIQPMSAPTLAVVWAT